MFVVRIFLVLKLLKELYLVFGIYYNTHPIREISRDLFYLVFNSYASALIK